MVAFRSAVDDWGADMLELDVRLSKDGVVMVIHDETVDRTTDGRGRVVDFTRDELQQLDAGHRFEDLDGESSFRGLGVTIPTLRELLEACPSVWLNVEAKEASVAGPLVDLIREHSHTCYLGERGARHEWGYGCGECPACSLRAKGWQEFVAAR